jgi:DNA-binding GntR family transcriptional regulator
VKKLRIPSNLTSLAYSSIKAYILDGRLDETSRLTEEFLSNQLGISKSPIREALNRLETEGLIHIEPRKGAYLKRLSPEEISELYDLREALETHVVRTVKLTVALVAELHQSLKSQHEFLRANDRPHYIEEDVHFHAELARATRNARLCAVLENIQNQIWISRRNSYDLSSSTAPNHHAAILEALESNDRDAAVAAMRAHIQRVKGRLLEHFEPAAHMN